jgi:hypothetical protein
MSVQTHPASLKVLRIVFEARYDEGYRYLDRCGETVVRIRKHSSAWLVGPVNPQGGVISNNAESLTLNMGNESMLVATTEEFEYEKAEKKVDVLAREAEALYGIIVETLSVPNTTRVGLRSQFFAPADSLEEANRFMSKAAASPLSEALRDETRMDVRNASMVYVLEDPKTGLRRRVDVSAVARLLAGAPPITGLASDQGSGGVVVDIDTLTRPERGHLPKAGFFITNNYLRERSLAAYVFRWLLEHQK